MRDAPEVAHPLSVNPAEVPAFASVPWRELLSDPRLVDRPLDEQAAYWRLLLAAWGAGGRLPGDPGRVALRAQLPLAPLSGLTLARLTALLNDLAPLQPDGQRSLGAAFDGWLARAVDGSRAKREAAAKARAGKAEKAERERLKQSSAGAVTAPVVQSVLTPSTAPVPSPSPSPSFSSAPTPVVGGAAPTTPQASQPTNPRASALRPWVAEPFWPDLERLLDAVPDPAAWAAEIRAHGEGMPGHGPARTAHQLGQVLRDYLASGSAQEARPSLRHFRSFFARLDRAAPSPKPESAKPQLAAAVRPLREITE